MDVNAEHQDRFDIERGRAIGAFAELECALCWVLVDAGGFDYRTASIIFYSNISMQPRLEITSALVEAAYGNTFQVFWESACKMIESLNKQRNKIVHWHGYPVFIGPDFAHAENILVHPVSSSENLSQLSVHDMRQFSEKARYTAKVLSAFRLCIAPSAEPHMRSDKVSVFSKTAIVFPAPKVDPFG